MYNNKLDSKLPKGFWDINDWNDFVWIFMNQGAREYRYSSLFIESTETACCYSADRVITIIQRLALQLLIPSRSRVVVE